jgi:hypothetical protein
MPASTTIPSVPVATEDNLVAAVNALRQALIAMTNTPAAQSPTASKFVVQSQVVVPVTFPTSDGHTVTVPMLTALTLVNSVTGETWSWAAPGKLLTGGTAGAAL